MRDRKDEQKMKKNVTLIGMPGSGKSTVGVVPVSYTHLDVYKRQVQDGLIAVYLLRSLIWRQMV